MFEAVNVTNSEKCVVKILKVAPPELSFAVFISTSVCGSLHQFMSVACSRSSHVSVLAASLLPLQLFGTLSGHS